MKSSEFEIERSTKKLSSQANLFLEKIFYVEQNIPKELLTIDSEDIKWWYIKKDNEIVALAAAWKINSEWHWGRLAIHKDFRGLGLGKKITLITVNEIFQMGIDKLIIDARDITVKMLLKIGGKITGKTIHFYGSSITAMELNKHDFFQKNNGNI